MVTLTKLCGTLASHLLPLTSGSAESTQALQAPTRGGTLARDKELKKLNEEIERLKKKLAGERKSSSSGGSVGHVVHQDQRTEAGTAVGRSSCHQQPVH